MSKKVVSSLVIGLFLIGVILGGTSCFGEKESTPGETQPAPTPTETKVIKITVPDLSDEYRVNEIAADQKYKNRMVTIAGLIADISREPATNEPYVDVGKVRCFFKHENGLLKLAKGQEIVVKGKCLGKKVEKEKTSFPIIFKDCSLIEETEFQLIDWEVVRSDIYSASGADKVCLGITFKKFGYTITFTVINPKGKEIPGGEAWWGCTDRFKDEPYSIPLTEEPYANPLPGEYKLVIKDVKGKVVFTQTFNFSGPHAEMEVKDEGGHWSHSVPEYHWQRPGKEWVFYWVNLQVSIKNSGELPFCFRYIEAFSESASEPHEEYDTKKIIAPGEEIVISIGTYYHMGEYRTWVEGLRFYSPGEKVVTLQFIDGAHEIVYSLNTTVTVPEKPPVE